METTLHQHIPDGGGNLGS